MECFLATMGRKKAERFLRLMAEKLASEENLSSVFQIRPTSEETEVARARRQAVEMYRRYLPIFLARIPLE